MIVTARNPNIALTYRQMSFSVNVENCSYFETNNANEETTATNKTNVSVPIIAAVSAFLALVIAVVVLLVCRAWRKKLSEGKRTDIKKTDENPTYGTYSRGCEEDGEYGDGDKVYVTDANDYYASD